MGRRSTTPADQKIKKNFFQISIFFKWMYWRKSCFWPIFTIFSWFLWHFKVITHFTHFLKNKRKNIQNLGWKHCFLRHKISPLHIQSKKKWNLKKNNFFYFLVCGGGWSPLGPQISGTKAKFKNPLGDAICIDTSFLQLPHMALHHLWSGL